MTLAPGSQLGPYRILAAIGAGGMGEVYRAHDSRLGRDVAIKVLPPVFAENPDRLKRFEQEARATAALNHPNVLAIHDVGIHKGSPYLVEELLVGESLRQRLSGGALPYRKAVDLAAQIAHGLAAAHTKGILHRDLKPENVFVTTEGVVKILDFGLAKLVRTQGDVDLSTTTTATMPLAVMGTAAYMSPEQARGQPLDQRSDIFALGVVLYEMLSGHSPFRKANLADTTSAILHEEPPPLTAIVQNCPPPLDTMVRRCLEKRPEDRFSSAHDLAITLEASSWPHPAAPGAVPALHRSRRHGLRVVLGVAAATLLVAAAVAGWRVIRGGKHAPSLDPKRVAVAAFENKTGELSLAGACALVTERITTGLSGVGGITIAADPAVVSRSTGESVTSSTEQTLQALALRTGAGLVITGAVYVTGTDLEIQARLVAPGEGRVIYAVEHTRGPRTALDPAIELLQQRLLGAVATYAEGFWIDPTLMRPPTLDAYQELVRAREIYNSDFPGSIRHAERAVALDPRCLFARYALVAFMMNQGECEQAAQQVAAMEGLRGDLTPLERLLLSLSTAMVAGRRLEELAVMRQMNELAPRLDWITHDLALSEMFANLPRAAVATLDRARPVPWGGLGEGGKLRLKAHAQHMLGEYAAQLATAREGRARFPGDMEFAALEIGALAALGRTAEVDRVVEEALAAPATSGSPGDVILEGALESRAHGHPDASARLAERAVEWYRGRLPGAVSRERIRSGLAGSLVVAGKWDEAQAMLAALARDHPDEIDFRARLGVLAARRGDRAEAERIAKELQAADEPCAYGTLTLARARIAAQLGDEVQTVALLRQAFSEGSPFSTDLHCDIDLEPLWGYPPFVELIKPKD